MIVIKGTITKTGELIYEVNGVKGKGCKALTKFLDSLASKIEEDTNTSEYNEKPQLERESIKN